MTKEKKAKEEMKYENIMTNEFKVELIFALTKSLLNTLEIAFIFFIIFSFLFISVAREQSMEPTIHEGDIVIFRRNVLNMNFKRGDVIIFDYEDENGENVYCKRIIGLPNDIVEYTEEGKVRINGVLLEEDYILGPTFSNNFENKVVVPKGQYLVLGDNRCLSADSRYFGTIKEEQIGGKLLLLIPTSKMLKKPQPYIW